MKSIIIKLVKGCVPMIFAIIMMGCGDGKVCDCCTKRSDCEFGLKCVDLIGGTGKVCGTAGLNTCYDDDCLGNSKGIVEDYMLASDAEDNSDTFAVIESLKKIFEDDDDLPEYDGVTEFVDAEED